MKRILTMIMMCMLIAALSACGTQNHSEESATDAATQTTNTEAQEESTPPQSTD